MLGEKIQKSIKNTNSIMLFLIRRKKNSRQKLYLKLLHNKS